MALSLIQSAAMTGRSKSTIHRAIKTGKLSATRNDDGSYSIDPAELFRVYPAEPQKTADMKQIGTHAEPICTLNHDSDLLRLKVEMLTTQLEREQETVNDLRKRLDKAENHIIALSPPAQPSANLHRFWARLWTRR